MTAEKLMGFLKELEKRVPPPANCHHVITYAQYGSDAAGWNDKLALQVNFGGAFICFFLGDGDFSGDLIQLLDTVEKSLGSLDANTQLGVSTGKYI